MKFNQAPLTVIAGYFNVNLIKIILQFENQKTYRFAFVNFQVALLLGNEIPDYSVIIVWIYTRFDNRFDSRLFICTAKLTHVLLISLCVI